MSKNKFFYGSNKVWITITATFGNSILYSYDRRIYFRVIGCATIGESYKQFRKPEKASAKKTLLSLIEGVKFNKALSKHIFSICAHESREYKISKILEIKEELIKVLS